MGRGTRGVMANVLDYKIVMNEVRMPGSLITFTFKVIHLVKI